MNSNPFDGIPRTSRPNRNRDFFVTEDHTQAILEECSSAEWRLIVALARYGGIRCPSELVLLRWDEVLWDKNRFVVHSPKTQVHEGGDMRIVPIFENLRPYLVEAFEEARDGATHLIPDKTDESNLRTTFLKYVTRAGLTPWPKLFQNLRSSCETELLDSGKYPAHVVASWMGHSVRVQREAYAQVHEQHFETAAGSEVEKMATKMAIRLRTLAHSGAHKLEIIQQILDSPEEWLAKQYPEQDSNLQHPL